MPVTPDPDDPRLRLRLWVDAKLVDETWVDAGNPDGDSVLMSAIHRQGALVRAAEDAGKVWMAETYDPAKPKAKAYSRAGTDPDGMVDPQVAP